MTRTHAIDLDTARNLEVQALLGTGLATPLDWDVVDVRSGDHDGLPVTVIRRQPGTYRLGGPHATVVADRDGRLLGYTNLQAVRPSRLPERAESRKAAFDLIRRAAGAYAEDLVVQWIKPHAETVTEDDGSIRTVTGMKVKTRHADGRYTWAVVGPDGVCLTYERGIRWDAVRARRGTAMWLHDNWIAAHDGVGPRLDPPYATTN